MRFEKITDTKIKIFFSFDDMSKNHISKKILFSNNPFSQNFIQYVLKTAEQNLNFKVDDENILVNIKYHDYIEGNIPSYYRNEFTFYLNNNLNFLPQLPLFSFYPERNKLFPANCLYFGKVHFHNVDQRYNFH